MLSCLEACSSGPSRIIYSFFHLLRMFLSSVYILIPIYFMFTWEMLPSAFFHKLILVVLKWTSKKIIIIIKRYTWIGASGLLFCSGESYNWLIWSSLHWSLSLIYLKTWLSYIRYVMLHSPLVFINVPFLVLPSDGSSFSGMEAIH